MNEHPNNPELSPSQLATLTGKVVVNVHKRIGSTGKLWTVHGGGSVELVHSDVGGVVDEGLYFLEHVGGGSNE